MKSGYSPLRPGAFMKKKTKLDKTYEEKKTQKQKW